MFQSTYFKRFLLVLLMFSVCSVEILAQEKDRRLLANAIDNHSFVFYAQWVTAYNGARRQLTPPYELLVTSDSVRCFLPFLGRMYTVPTPEELRFMSIDFISKKFSYEQQKKSKPGWDFTIRPSDVRNVRDLHFRISEGGWTTLTIRSPGRDRVSYEGVTESIPR